MADAVIGIAVRLGPVPSRTDKNAAVLRGKEVKVIGAILILDAGCSLGHTGFALWTAGLTISCEIDVDVLAQGTNVFTANCLVDVLVVIDEGIVGFFAGEALVEIGPKACGTAFAAGLTTSGIVIGKETIGTFLDTNVTFEVDFESSGGEVAGGAVGGEDVAGVAVVVAFSAQVGS